MSITMNISINNNNVIITGNDAKLAMATPTEKATMQSIVKAIQSVSKRLLDSYMPPNEVNPVTTSAPSCRTHSCNENCKNCTCKKEYTISYSQELLDNNEDDDYEDDDYEDDDYPNDIEYDYDINESEEDMGETAITVNDLIKLLKQYCKNL